MTLQASEPGPRVLIAFTLILAIAAVTWSIVPAASSDDRRAQVAVVGDDWWRYADVATPAQPAPVAGDDWWRDASRTPTAPSRAPVGDAWWRDPAPPGATRPVAAVQVSDDGFDRTDALLGAAIALALVAITGFGIALTIRHRGPRHPRGPAVPVG